MKKMDLIIAVSEMPPDATHIFVSGSGLTDVVGFYSLSIQSMPAGWVTAPAIHSWIKRVPRTQKETP
jgi:hypothetical protein